MFFSSLVGMCRNVVTRERRGAVRAIAMAGVAALLGACSSLPSTSSTQAMPLVRAQGTQWVTPDGKPIALRGTNLGNWLMLEFWMMGQSTKEVDDQCTLEGIFDRRFGYAERERLMKLFRDHWITSRDWDVMQRFGLNLVRVPFIWSVIEDEKNPRHLRADAWRYLDDAINQAQARGMYVVLDLHGAPGSQGHEHHSGCAGKNLYWTTPEYQDRAAWLWTQVATRYKNQTNVLGYSVMNEPWGADEGPMAVEMKKLYTAIRAVDDQHVVIFPGHAKGIDAYGDLAAQGYKNIAFEMHFYPGHFGWAKPGAEVHHHWLNCIPAHTGSCEWRDRLTRLNTPFFVGEFQPWADMSPELGGQITRATFDTYVKHGWASALWSYKMVTPEGGKLGRVWGIVMNGTETPMPTLDFAKASITEIEARFKLFGTVPYVERAEVLRWMKSPSPPTPFTAP